MELTREELKAEIEEKAKDLDVFVRARDLIRGRVQEVADSESPLTPLPMWSGTDAVLGSLDLSIHAMERTLDELRVMFQHTEETAPKLRLVTHEES